MRKLTIVRRQRPATARPLMSPGDLLYRLSLISPDDYRAIIALATVRYYELWPHAYDILDIARSGHGV